MNNDVVLVIVAHADDETIGMGGTIKRHVENGDEVLIMSMTNGVGSRDDNNQNEIHDMVINNYKNFKGINISKRTFIKEGSGGLCCERWYKKNLKLFKN